MQLAQITSAFDAALLNLLPCFTTPSAGSFSTIAWGWVLCLGRPTLTRLVRSAGEGAAKHVSSYNRFFSQGAWSLDDLWRHLLVQVLLPTLAPHGPLLLAVDDTTTRRPGRHVAFAGSFRDPVRSTHANQVFHWAHNWVVLCLLLRHPLWPDRVLAFPVLVRLYRRLQDCDPAHPLRTRQQLALDMVRLVRQWVPGRPLLLVADGAFPGRELVLCLPPGVHFLSRIRRNAALYALARPPRRPRPGRRRVKGDRLPPLPQIARSARFRMTSALLYGERRRIAVHSFVALWHRSTGCRPLRVLVVRDPSRRQPDDFFFTTDLQAPEEAMVEAYAARWAIEQTFRDAKQSLGFGAVQGWCPRTAERQAPFALLLVSLVRVAGLEAAVRSDSPCLPTFHAILLTLRLAHWERTIPSRSLPAPLRRQLRRHLVAALASAA